MFNNDKTSDNSLNPFKGEDIKENIEDVKEEKTKNEETEIKSKEDELKAEIEDINNKYLRLAADFDNYRKRQLQERESLIKYGAEDTLKKIIPVLDTFERAKKSIEKLEDINTVKDSYEVCIKQLNDVLDKIGLKKIEAKGKDFDPNIHEAVMQTPSKDYPPHTVIDELQTGYMLHDRVLRPVMVNVATEAPDEINEEQ